MPASEPFISKGAFIIYEGGGGGGGQDGCKFENFHFFFSDPPKISNFFRFPPPPLQELNVYSNISMMISLGLVFQIYNFT